MGIQPEAGLIPRHADGMVRSALADSRIVLVDGARQVGKSTLARAIVAGTASAAMATLDNPAVLEAARADPITFVEHEGLMVIDEVQRAPELLLAIKASVDRERRPGQFLLTGSAQVLALPQLSDSLAGRMDLVDLHPFSQGELEGRREGFVDELMKGGARARMGGSLRKEDYLDRAVLGGFPEVVARPGPASRARWFAAYVRTLVQRDLHDLMDIQRGHDVGRLLRLLAARTATVVNVAALSRDIELPQATLGRYLGLLEMTFVIARIPAWSNNRIKRVVKAPKLVFGDAGLNAFLLGATTAGLMLPTGRAGQVLEAFVLSELRKQLTWAQMPIALYHFRSREGAEVDAVLEAADGRVAGVEVKAAATVRDSDFHGLRRLAAAAGAAFAAGVVLYTGPEPLSFGGGLWALPLSTLWESA